MLPSRHARAAIKKERELWASETQSARRLLSSSIPPPPSPPPFAKIERKRKRRKGGGRGMNEPGEEGKQIGL